MRIVETELERENSRDRNVGTEQHGNDYRDRTKGRELHIYRDRTAETELQKVEDLDILQCKSVCKCGCN